MISSLAYVYIEHALRRGGLTLQTSLVFPARTAVVLIAAFEEAIGWLDDVPDAARDRIAVVRHDLERNTDALLHSPGDIDRLDHHVDALLESARRHLSEVHPLAVERLAQIRQAIDCARCAGPTRVPCTSARDDRELLAAARCTELFDRVVDDILAFLREEPTTAAMGFDVDLEVDTTIAARSRVDGLEAGLQLRYERHRERLTILVEHERERSSLSFAATSVYALPYLVFDALVSRAMYRSTSDLDPFRDGWLAFVAFKLCQRWSERSVVFPQVMLERCVEAADEIIHDRTRASGLAERGETAALEARGLLRVALASVPAPAGPSDRATDCWLRLSSVLIANRSALEANEIIWLVGEAGRDPRIRERLIRKIVNYLELQDYDGLVDCMIEFVESFA